METYESPIAVMYCCACWMTRRPVGESCGCWVPPVTCGIAAMARSAAAVAAATLDPPAVSRAGVVVPLWAANASSRWAGSMFGWCLPVAVVAAWAKAS